MYVIGYLAWWRVITYFVATDLAPDDVRDGEALAVAMFVSLIFSLFWPLLTVGLIANRIYVWRGDTITAFFVPRDVRKRAELDEREQRIEAMEREVGIK